MLTLIQAVCERRSSGFIDDTEHIQAGNTSRILGCLPLRIIEIGGNGDHRVLDLVAQRCFRVSFELAQNKCGKLGRCVIPSKNFQTNDVLAFGRDFEGKQRKIFSDILDAFPHETLDREDGVFRVFDHLFFRAVADEDLPGTVEIDDGRHQLAPVRAGKNRRRAILHDRHQAVCSS